MDDKELVRISQSEEFRADLAKVKRWDLLPLLFRVKGKPFTLKGREQFSVLFSEEFVRETIIIASRQVGKCVKISKKDDFLTIRNSNGIRMDTSVELPPATCVSSESSSEYVQGIVSAWMDPGKKRILRITTALGNVINVSPEHKVRTFDGYVEASALRVGSRVASMRKCYSFGTVKESEYRIALTAYFIGDGHCGNADGKGNFDITAKRQVEERILDLCDCEGDLVRDSPCANSCMVRRVNFSVYSPIRRYLVDDGLAGKLSHEKFIPDWVFMLDEQCTRMFVESLWSTDGNITVTATGLGIEYVTSSPLLASDVRALLSKFGIASSLRKKKAGYKKDGVYHACRDAYIVRVYGYRSQKKFLDTFNVLDRDIPKIHVSKVGQDDRSNRDTLPEEGLSIIGKLAGYLDMGRNGHAKRGMSLHSTFASVGGEVRRKPKYPISRFKLEKYLQAFRILGLDDKPEYARLKEFADGDVIYDRVVSIEDIGEHPAFDIEVAGTNNFIIGNICVHNSMSLSRSEIFNLLSIPEFQVLYVAPLQEQTRRYSDLYITEAIQSCPLAQKLQQSNMSGVLSDAKIIKATGHQSFANGSGIQLTYAKTSADRARGIMCDVADFDEIQDQSPDTIPIIQESLTSSEKYGCSRYTGTAKVVENLIETKWQQSSQCEWVMKCQHCGTWAIPTLDGNVLQMIQADGMHCLHCGGRLDVSVGQWVAAYPDRMGSFRGYHIPQVVCPFIVNNRNNWDKLIHKLMNGVLTTFIQENLGISYSVGQRLLTMQHIRRQCILPSTRTLQEEVKNNPMRYSFVVAGIDWGGAELSSFTVITVIGIRPEGRIDVLWARRYRGFDPDEQMEDIAKVCRYYNVTACLDADSLVLTKTELTGPCYKRIVDVTTADLVWDGEWWVRHEGVRLMRYVHGDELVNVGNTTMTGDHRVYISDRESVRADSLSGGREGSARVFHDSNSPLSGWRDVWLHVRALCQAFARLARESFRKVSSCH